MSRSGYSLQCTIYIISFKPIPKSHKGLEKDQAYAPFTDSRLLSLYLQKSVDPDR